MKKRILAMLLVLCMVASVMPMTVLAAEVDCPKEHTLKNCEATLVLHVPAENCAQRDYDLYECDDCGALFADNFGDYGDHDLQYDEDATQYSCGAGKVCRVPRCYAYDWDNDEYYSLKHKFDCYGKCSCGEEGPAGHVWDQKLIEITKEPVGCSVPGEATYHCAVCDATKIAPVYGKHIELKHVAYEAPDCDKTGTKEHDYCSACDTYWMEGKEVEAADVIIPAEHTKPTSVTTWSATITSSFASYTKVDCTFTIEVTNAAVDVRIYKVPGGALIFNEVALAPYLEATILKGSDGVYSSQDSGKWNYMIWGKGATINVTEASNDELVNYIPPTCDSQGVIQYNCAKCGELVTEMTAVTAHNWVLDDYRSQPATCYKYGYEFWICADCGEAKPIKIISKLPCIDTWAEVEAYNKANPNNKIVPLANVAATCTQPGYYAWECPYCLKTLEDIAAGKLEVDYEIDPLKEWEPKATGCKLLTGTYPATKCTKGYVYKYCTNKGCYNTAAHTDYNKSISAIVGKDVHEVIRVVDEDPNADHPWVLDSTSATCTEAGYELYLCVCGDYKLVQVNAYGHSGYTTQKNKVNTLVIEEATCTDKGCSYYTCKDCGQVVYVTKNIPFVHKALMSIDEVLKYHGATNGVVAYVDITGDGIADEVSFEDVIDPDTMYDPELSLWTVVPSCEKVGYINVECKDCLLNERKHSITVYAGGSHAIDYSKLDCNGLQCPICGELVKGPNHDWSTPAVTGDCFTEGVPGYGKCSICGAERTLEEAIREDGNVSAGHIWKADAYIKGGCDKWAGQPYTCERDEMHSVIIDYVPNLHYVNPALSDPNADDNGGTVSKNEEKSDKFAGCMESGTVVYSCTVKNCGYEYEVELTGLGYHVNIDGYKIDYSACPACNKEANNCDPLYVWTSNGRFNSYTCQYCNTNLQQLGKYPSCSEPGYNVFGWTCGHSGYLGYEPATGHAWSEERVDFGIYTAYVCENYNYDAEIDEWVLCGEQRDLKSTGDVILSISDDIGENEIITDGSLVTITVDMTAYKADLFGYSFKIWYLANALEFVDYEVLTENFKYNALVHNNVSLNEDLSFRDDDGKLVYGIYDGLVSVVGQSKTDGKNVQLTGTEDLVAITFKVINAEQFFKWAMGEEMPPFAAYATSRPQLDYALPFPVEIGDIEIVKNNIENGKVVDVEYIDAVEYDSYDEEWYPVYYLEHTIPVNRLMDADFNGEVNYRDAAIVWQMASGAIAYKYAEHLDLNGNGEIDHVDAKLIYQYFVGILTYDEVLNYNA